MQYLKRITHAKYFKKGVIATFIAISIIAWFGMWVYGHYAISTNDAYVNANIVQIAPRITGKIMQLHVKNNQYVKKGQPLFDIDSEPFQLAVNSAQAQLTLSYAELDNALTTKNRVMEIVKKKFLSAQEGDNVTANYKTAAAKLEQAKANLAQANLNLEYTHVVAPTSGWVTNMTTTMGEIVPAGRTLFSLISDELFWVDANFKETELQKIKPGQIAIIKTDLYPDHPYKGVVESISGGSGSVFSLLPPQNATGNWVKITQRIPVRITVLNPDSDYPLRIGISTEVTIKLKQYLSPTS